ncbi:MAG: hypothetical protein ACFB4I_14910 [Cyanophyceae cyanobacterium]
MHHQMSWLPISKTDKTKILHLRTHPQQSWQPYTAFPELAVPDHQVPGASQGYATYQKLRREGWVLLPNLK